MCAFRHCKGLLYPSVLTLFYCLAVIIYLSYFILLSSLLPYCSVLSPQIHIKIFKPDLRFLCLLICSFLSQVKYQSSVLFQPQSLIDSFPSIWCGICQDCFLCHHNFSIAESYSCISQGFNYLTCSCVQIQGPLPPSREMPKRRLYDTEEGQWVEPELDKLYMSH